MTRHILQIIACYFVGLIVGNLIFILCTGSLALVLAFGGTFFALPILVLVVVVFALMSDRILRYLAIWCIIAPWLVVVIWLAVEWETNYSHRGHDIYWYLSLRNVWERAVLAFTCASVSSALFWHWNRAQVRPLAATEREQAEQPETNLQG
jgi:ABC-type antimicrobial peptide transport system permease subunit